jgi:hypothetical protein
LSRGSSVPDLGWVLGATDACKKEAEAPLVIR